MKRIHLLFVLVVFTGSLWAAQPLRQNININRDWKFKLGDYPGGEMNAFDDTTWNAINLPHSFEIPYFMSKEFHVGYGWYRKHLEIKPAWAAKRICVEFDGAFQDAEVYVNGTRIAEHKGGFTGFSMDITSSLHPGDNLLAVRLNNIWNAQIEPRSGDHTFMGGIYRNVRLVVTNPLHVTWYGTFVTTPDVSKDAATVNVKTEITNESLAAKGCTVTTDIIDPEGKPVAHLSTTRSIAAGATIEVEQTSPTIFSPELWHPSHPFLYTAATTLSNRIAPVDNYQTTFGIRSISWTADQGFFINGEHFYFHGANVHQDHAGWGDAITDAGSFRDVKLVKDAGLDFIRGSHYPHHPAFATACDQLGVLFWSENCFWGMGRGQKEGSWMTSDAYPPHLDDQASFEQNALDTLRDEIRIFRNHPSVIAWSTGNEVFFSDHLDKVKGLLTKLVDETHRLDPTRPAAIGGCQRGDLDKLGDVAGYNGDGARLPQFQNPGIPSVVSEYGSHISDRGDAKTDVYDGLFNEKELNANTPEYPWRSGQSLWCAFDYSTVLGHFGCMGFVDYFRIPKRSWYWYRNQYLHVPPPEWPREGTPAKLSLITDKSTIMGTDGTDDCQLLVTVRDASGNPISNSLPVTFSIESGPGEFPTGRSITFHPPSQNPSSDIAIRDGQAAIELRSYFGGKTIIRASSPGLEDGTVTITTVGDPAFVSGESSLAPDRPYARFIQSSPQVSASQNAALNHPASASSEAPGHTADLAVDGKPGTGWQATDATGNAWWQIDLEALYSIQSVEITFGKEGNTRYKIEASSDGILWTLLVDRTETASTAQIRTDSCKNNEHTRYLRLTLFNSATNPATLVDEIKINATPSP